MPFPDLRSYMWAIPFDRAFHRLPKRLTQGWQLQGITRFATGFPIQMGQSNPIDPSQANASQLCPGLLLSAPEPCVGDSSLAGSPSTDMPNVAGPVHIHNPRDTPGTFTYFDQGAFVATNCFFTGTTPSPDCGTFGTANRRFFHGPGINNTDLGITKRIPVTESKAFEIRCEFFNIFNHAQFVNPSGDISSGSFGNITNARDPRIGQVSGKFVW